MKKLLTYLALCCALLISNFSYGQNVTEIITDFQGYWRSGVRPNVNAVAPNNSHDLLSFTVNGQRYSTGVKDNVLTANGLSFIPSVYRALPISTLPAAPATNTFIGLGQLYDGAPNGGATPPPANNIPFYLTDGINGLNLGTAVYNLPVSNLVFDVGLFNISRIGDGIPDIIVTQMGDIAASVKDTFRFVNPSGQQVGNSVAVTFANADTLGLCDNDFYNANTNPMGFASGFYPSNTKRAIRVYAFELSDFGISSANFGDIDKFVEKLSGQSDQAFVAYNTGSLQILPNNNPGCFSNLPGLWMKANDGTSTITNNQKVYSWEDRSPNVFSLQEATPANEPVFKDATNSFNYNAYLDFNSQNKLIGPNSPFTDSTSNADIFIVGRPTNSVNTRNKILGFSRNASDNTSGGAGDFPSFNYNQLGQLSIDSGNVNLVTSTSTGNLNTIFLEQINYTQGASAAINLFKNGIADGSVNVAKQFGKWTFQLGDKSPGNDSTDFDLAEVIVFPRNLLADERIKVESYLGIKYGLTLGHDYVAGSGLTTWNRTNNAGNNNTIFGIGREDCQAMHRKQSKSVLPNALITIGHVGIALDNISNFNLMTNGTFEMMGDNNGSLALQATEVPASCYQRIGREWKVQETGTVGPVFLRVPANTSALAVKLPVASNGKMYMLVDNDGDFSSGLITVVPMTLNGTDWELSYNFADGNFYTFATDNGLNQDFNDLPSPWPGAVANVNGCNTNGDAVINNSDVNGTRQMAWAGNAITTEGAALTNSVATADGADDGLIIPSTISLNQNNNFTVVLNTNVPGTTIYYRLWIDWNKDGNFGNDLDGSGARATYAGSAVLSTAGALNVPVNVIPPSTATTDYTIRLIVSTAAITDSYTATPAFVYSVANGEIEDYYVPTNVLPVTLKSFTATATGCNVQLNWETLSELNTTHFDMESSNDGIRFTTIATITAKNIATGTTYHYADNVPGAGEHYYRLKIVDRDNRVAYSGIAMAKTNCGDRQVTISPNPARDYLLIKGLQAEEQVTVTDASGRTVLNFKASGIQHRTDISMLADGVYFVRTVKGAVKFIKVP